MTWYVTRKPDGTLASIHRDLMAGYNDEALADDSAEVVAFLAAAVPYVAPDPKQWLERLSPAKQAAISAAAAADVSGTLLLWLLKAAGTGTVDVADPEAAAGVNALVGAGILTSTDATTLLTP